MVVLLSDSTDKKVHNRCSCNHRQVEQKSRLVQAVLHKNTPSLLDGKRRAIIEVRYDCVWLGTRREACLVPGMPTRGSSPASSVQVGGGGGDGEGEWDFQRSVGNSCIKTAFERPGHFQVDSPHYSA